MKKSQSKLLLATINKPRGMGPREMKGKQISVALGHVREKRGNGSRPSAWACEAKRGQGIKPAGLGLLLAGPAEASFGPDFKPKNKSPEPNKSSKKNTINKIQK